MTANLKEVPVTVIPENKSAPKLINLDFPIESVTVVVVQKGKDGDLHEVVHTIDGTQVSIVDYQFNIKQKHAKAKTEEGMTIGFEPTGEETLKLVLSYIRNP